MSLQNLYKERSFIIEALDNYKKFILEKEFFEISRNLTENSLTLEKILNFIKETKNCFNRESLAGHITSSALITNQNFSKVLLTYHAKLKKWLQLGGHCDGEYLIHLSAIREAKEESGLNDINFVDIFNFPHCTQIEKFPTPFDIDIHAIPARKDEPEHFHYDIRYLLVADESENIVVSEESLDLKWINLSDINKYSEEISTLRQVEKLKYLVSKLR